MCDLEFQPVNSQGNVDFVSSSLDIPDLENVRIDTKINGGKMYKNGDMKGHAGRGFELDLLVRSCNEDRILCGIRAEIWLDPENGSPYWEIFSGSAEGNCN